MRRHYRLVARRLSRFLRHESLTLYLYGFVGVRELGESHAHGLNVSLAFFLLGYRRHILANRCGGSLLLTVADADDLIRLRSSGGSFTKVVVIRQDVIGSDFQVE